MSETDLAGPKSRQGRQDSLGNSGNLYRNSRGLDILTARGQRTLEDERAAVNIWSNFFPAYKYVQTPKDKPAVVDAFIIKDNEIRAAVETKCRYDMTLESFKTERGERWLITHDKLETARFLCAQLQIPLVGFLYFVRDKILLYKALTDERGNYTIDVQVEQTKTQKTVNGGEIVRTNAFVDMSGAKVLK